MTNFVNLELIFENLVKYFTFSYAALAGVILIIFAIILLQRGFDFKYTTIFSMPILFGFIYKGWFGTTSWIGNAILIIAGLFYAVAILQIFK